MCPLASRVFQLEVCVERVEDALAAAEAGATRIEMNSALACSGLTPSLASCQWLVENCPVPVVSMLRPHDAGFFYSRREQELMLRDCALLLETGVHGIVAGGLTGDGQIDVALTTRLVAATGNRDFVFHRAFDELADQMDGLAKLIDCGVTRVLTSGGALSAIAGADKLRSLVQQAGEHIEILPAAGINSSNVEQIVSQAACRQVHGSFRRRQSMAQGLNRGPDLDDIRATAALLQRLEAARGSD